MKEIVERDWKFFHNLVDDLVNRFYARTLDEVAPIVADKGGSGRERFWAVMEKLKERRAQAANMFDALGRKNALIGIAMIKHQGLFTPEELAHFSEQTQEFFKGLEDGRY